MEFTSSEQPDTPPSVPRSRYLLTLKRALIALAALILLIGCTGLAVWVYVRSEAFNRLVAEQINAALKDYGLRSEIGGTKISLKAQTARLSDFKIFNDESGELIASLKLVEVDVDIREPYALRLNREIVLKGLNLEGVDLYLDIDEQGRANIKRLRSRRDSKERITVDYSQLLATITNSAIHVKDRARRIATDLTGIRITARPHAAAPLTMALQLESAGGRLSYQDKETAVEKLSLAGIVSEEGARFDYLNLKAGVAELTANGKIDDWKAFRYGFDFDTRVKLEEAARLFQADATMNGHASAKGRIEGEGATYKINGGLNADEMTVAATRLRGAQIAQFNVESRENSIDFTSSRVRAESATVDKLRIGSIVIDNFKGDYKDGHAQANSSNAHIATVEWPDSKLSNLTLNGLAISLNPSDRSLRYLVRAGARLNQGVIAGVNFNNATTQAVFDNSALALNGIKAELLGGSVSGEFTLPIVRGAASRAKASFIDIETNDVFSMIAGESDMGNQVPLAGKISGDAEVSISGANLRTLAGTINASFDGKASDAPDSIDAVPVTGRASVKAHDGVFEIGELQLSTDASKILAGGKLSIDGESDLRVSLNSTQAEQFIQIARSIEAARPFIADYEPQIIGDLKFDGRLSGPLEKPIIEGDVNAATIGLRDALIGGLTGRIIISPDEIRVEKGMISATNGGSLKFDLNTPLGKEADSGMVVATIDRIDLATILAAAGSPDVSQFITGEVSGEANLTGLPANFNGTAQLNLVDGKIANQDAQSAAASLKFSGKRAEVERLDVRMAESQLNASGELNLDDFSFKLQGKSDQISLQSLVDAFELKDTRVDGTANLELVVSGKTMADKKTELDWESLELRLIAQGKDVKINGRDAGVLRFGARTGNGGRLSFGLVTGILSTTAAPDRPEVIRGSIELRKPGRPATIIGNLVNQNIAPVIELFAPNLKMNVEGNLSGSLRLEGPTIDEIGNATFEQLRGGLTLTKVELAVEETPVKIETPVTIELAARQVNVSGTRIIGPGIDLSFNGTLGLMNDAGLDFALKGTVNLGQLPALIPDYTFSGTMVIDARATGTAGSPQLSGRIDASEFGLTSKNLPIIIAGGTGTIKLAGDRMTLDKFTANANDGTLEINGQARVAEMQPSEWRFDLKGRDVVINYQDVAATANGDLSLQGTQQGQTLGGSITIPQAEYVPRIDLDNLLAGGTTGLTSAGFGRIGGRMRRSGIPPISLNIRVEADDSLIVQNKQINAVGSALINLNGTLNNPDPVGRIESDGGTVRFRGQRYEITSGSIEFPTGNGEPILNLSAESEIGGYRVTIGFVGPVDAIELNLQSEPSLSRDEVIALITTGRAEIGSMTSQDLLRSGAGAAASLVTSNFISKPTEELLGISRFQIDPVIRPNTNPAARLTIGQQFSRNLYLSYSTNLASDQFQTALAEYTITSRFSALASFTQGGVSNRQGQNDGVLTIELRGRKRFSLGFSPDDVLGRPGAGAGTSSNRPARPKLPTADVNVSPVEDLKLKDSKLRDLLPVMTQGFSRSLARLGESRLREYLQEQGYFFAEVNYRCDPENCSGEKLKVYYDIHPNAKHDLAEIRIEGTDQVKLPDVVGQLQSQTASRVGGVPFLKDLPLIGGYVRGLTSNDRLRNDEETIRRALRDLGFRTARVQSRWGVKPESDDLVVIFDVVEGPQSTVAGINLRGNTLISAQELREAIPIQRGEAFSRPRARAGAQQIKQLYEQQGFLEAEATLELGDTAEDGIILIYKIDEGVRAIVGEIEITGLTKTGEDWVRHYLDFKIGDVLTPAKVRRTQRDLFATNAFREVTISSVPTIVGDGSAHKVTVKLTEAKPMMFVYGLGFSTDDGIRGLSEITNTNLYGTLNSLSLRMRASRIEQFSQLSFTDMRPFGWRLPTTVSAYYNRNSDLQPFVRPRVLNMDGSVEDSEDDIGLGIQRLAAFIQTERKLDDRTSLRFRYNLERAKLFGDDIDVLPDTEVTRNERAIRLGMISVGFTRDDRDSVLNPTRGSLASLENSIAATMFGGNESFNKFFGTYQTYKTLDPQFPLLGNSTLAFSARIGLARMFRPSDRNGNGIIDGINENSSERRLPITERFFTGGATTLRGFRYEAAGPQVVLPPRQGRSCNEISLTDKSPTCDLPTFVPVGGDALTVFNFELRYPLSERFRIVPFYDLGNAFRRVRDINFSNMTNSVGLGLRIITPIGPIGVDYGFLIDPPSYPFQSGIILRQPRGAFHIRFGQSF
jgi:outer membrane protein assembly complex protein YaeT